MCESIRRYELYKGAARMGGYYLAIDIGASSGRHILGHIENGRMILEEIHRFDNKQVHQNGHDCWDMDNLWSGILDGLKACKTKGKIPETIGIDTWAVDFVLIDAENHRIGDAVAYRDSRTETMDKIVEQIIPPADLYARTGIQKQPFNTIYQLTALKQEHPEQLEQADFMLMIPDYFNCLLTGVRKQEYTNATSTNLVNAHTNTWDRDLIEKLGFPSKLFGELSMPGTVVGNLTAEIQSIVGFDATVILPATHDTGSAFLAVPAKDADAVYLSSGTWSLLGVENEKAITTEDSRQRNFTNEGGAWYRYRYLKNIMGLWMIQNVKKEIGGELGFGEICDQAAKTQISSIVDCNDQRFLAPDNMTKEVQKACEESGQQVPEGVAEVAAVIYQSLAHCYKKTLEELETLTGKKYERIHVIGGGANADYLNRLTTDVTGVPVCAGPTEATAVGNLAAQMITGGEFTDLKAARTCIYTSLPIRTYTPDVRR